MKKFAPDMDYVRKTLCELLEIPSPAGFTDEAVRYTCEQLEALGIPFEITRRGAIRADMKGKSSSHDRAIVAHLDTLGAMVSGLKDNGRLRISPIGTWSSRFAEGAHATIYGDNAHFEGTILPIKAAGHTFNTEIDELPVSWDTVELRVDHPVYNAKDLEEIGINVGDIISINPGTRMTDTGFICSRYLDDKAGVAVLLAMAREAVQSKIELPMDCHLLFTISEEVGSGASAVLHGDVAEMLTIDAGPSAPGQNTDEFGVTVCMKDSTGPFDFHLTHKLLRLCEAHDIRHKRDVFRYYRCDSASAIEAGNDIRTALVCFGTDATHGFERCHENSLIALGELLSVYLQSDPTFDSDRDALHDSVSNIPSLPV
ncbi:MAG TPA: osmoprotectant NAGGN system M42 family peptidase [Woeseiaceae bacterium]|nr:osmoprotectant NAGGN system M42 family peptidase [Woeseiaceae bacterium]